MQRRRRQVYEIQFDRELRMREEYDRAKVRRRGRRGRGRGRGLSGGVGDCVLPCDGEGYGISGVRPYRV
jgi:hypothetical protein